MFLGSEQLFGELAPVLLPLVACQCLLLGYCLWHILTHKSYKRGTRTLWILVSAFITFIGPILYLTLGKSNEQTDE